MTLARWFRSVFAPRPAVRMAPPTRRLAVELLEDRLTPSTGGSLDPTFGSGGVVTNHFSDFIDMARDVLVQPDGKTVIAGQANGGRTANDFLIARYNANGSLDTTFGSSGRTLTDFNNNADAAAAVALQPGTSGKILAGGAAYSVKHNTSNQDFALVRYNANGTLDTTFGSNGKVLTDLGTTNDKAFAMAVQPDGRIILAGWSGANLALVRYTASGALDSTFGTGGKLLTDIPLVSDYSDVLDVGLQGDGRIVVAGSTTGGDFLVARFNANGTTDTSFGGGAGRVTTDFGGRTDNASGLAIQSDGRIVVVGSSNDAGMRSDIALARYNPDGSLDASFEAGGLTIMPVPLSTYSQGHDVLIQTDGRIVVAGGATPSGVGKAIAVRFNTDGTVDTGFGPAGTGVSEAGVGNSYALAIQPDGKIVLAGTVNDSGGRPDVALFRLLSSAPQIGSFTANPGPVTAGSDVTLTASGITDGNPGSSITQVAFYLDSNNDGILEPGTDTLLGYGTQSGGTWTLTFSTAGWASAVDTLFAQAKDNYGVLSDPLSLSLQVL